MTHNPQYALDDICYQSHNLSTTWIVRFADAFEAEFDRLPVTVQDEMLAQACMIEYFGPETGRPRVDTLKGSKYPNMKELRFDADGGVQRVAFAFDPAREAILLIAGDKSGGAQRRFYKRLISLANERFTTHLERLSRGPE